MGVTPTLPVLHGAQGRDSLNIYNEELIGVIVVHARRSVDILHTTGVVLVIGKLQRWQTARRT